MLIEMLNYPREDFKLSKASNMAKWVWNNEDVFVTATYDLATLDLFSQIK